MTVWLWLCPYFLIGCPNWGHFVLSLVDCPEVKEAVAIGKTRAQKGGPKPAWWLESSGLMIRVTDQTQRADSPTPSLNGYSHLVEIPLPSWDWGVPTRFCRGNPLAEGMGEGEERPAEQRPPVLRKHRQRHAASRDQKGGVSNPFLTWLNSRALVAPFILIFYI